MDDVTETNADRRLRNVGRGWIGVDLDGTLAEYHGWVGALEIGAPIPAMVERIRCWLAEGHEVRIMTARYPLGETVECFTTGTVHTREEMRQAILAYTLEHVGTALEPTCVKDLHMIELWDDRAVQVVMNTGRTLAEEHESELAALRGAP